MLFYMNIKYVCIKQEKTWAPLKHSYLSEKLIASLKDDIPSNSFKYASLSMVRSSDISIEGSKFSSGVKFTPQLRIKLFNVDVFWLELLQRKSLWTAFPWKYFLFKSIAQIFFSHIFLPYFYKINCFWGVARYHCHRWKDSYKFKYFSGIIFFILQTVFRIISAIALIFDELWCIFIAKRRSLKVNIPHSHAYTLAW